MLKLNPPTIALEHDESCQWKMQWLGSTLAYCFYAYQTTFKLTMGHTPFQLVYGFHSLMAIEYLLPINSKVQNFLPNPLEYSFL